MLSLNYSHETGLNWVVVKPDDDWFEEYGCMAKLAGYWSWYK